MLWLWNWSLVCLSVLLGGVRAGTLNIQDNNPGMMYSGSWYPDASPNAYGKHETWTNSSGASVYYDFQGTEVQVFATMRPTGTYLTNVSFQIDDGAPAFWVTTAPAFWVTTAPAFWVTTAPVPQETFNKLVYTSPGTLAADGTHRITITNYGFVFWLVYLQITTPDVSGGSSDTTSATTTTTTTAVATAAASASTTTTTTGTGTQTSSAGTTSAGTSGARTSNSSTGTSGSSTGTSSSSSAGSNTGPSSASTASSNSNTGTSSAGGASATSDTSSTSASRTPVIIGAAVGSVGGAALLLAALCFWCMYSKSRSRALAPTPFDGEANPAPHLAKDRPPAHPPSRFQRWMAGSQPAASEPGYGYPSTGAPEAAALERAQSEPVDAEALKQLAAFRAARAAPPPPARALQERERPPPAASIPSVLETPHPSTMASGSPRSAAPVSRSGALARAFSFSSPFSRDPARGRFPPSDAPTQASTALASSGVLPPPSPYVRPAPASTRPVFFRVLRRSRDGGVRLAGGAPGESGAAMAEAPEEYDRQILDAMSEGGSTLPPEYQQYPAGVGGEGR